MSLDSKNDRSFAAGVGFGCWLILMFLMFAVGGALAARKWWPVMKEQTAVIVAPAKPMFLPDKTRDAAVEMSKACIKSGKDVYWDTFISEAGEAIHVACPQRGKAAHRVIAKTK